MTEEVRRHSVAPTPMIMPFPEPGPLVKLAYRELHLAINGTPEQQKALGNHAQLPRPWEPATCCQPSLRREVWTWLDDVVIWLNHDYTWDTAALVPNCWPLHPHLVHEVAVLADQRRRAGLAMTSDALEEWHRYGLPAFTERLRERLRAHCDDGHRPWPGRPRHAEHLSMEHGGGTFASDVASLSERERLDSGALRTLRLGLVDLDSGEIIDPSTATAQQPRTRTEKGPRL